MEVDRSTWQGTRVLVTGHTGFKGAWLTLWLERLGALVSGISLPPAHPRGAWPAMGPWLDIDSHEVDVRDHNALEDAVGRIQPEVVFHLAAQALVRTGYADPVTTFATNVTGTVNLLDAVRSAASARAIVIVTSDKVYENPGADCAFTESDRLGGSDPYSSSKACAELAVASWRKSFLSTGPTGIATARAGNVMGGGDRGRDRLLPDAFDALTAGEPLQLRYPAATRPWQFVLDPLRGYLLLAQHLLRDAPSDIQALNFGPTAESGTTAHEVVDRMHALWGAGSWVKAPIPPGPEAPYLRLDATKAFDVLGWKPMVDLDLALRWTADWWRCEAAGGDLRTLATTQLLTYQGMAA